MGTINTREEIILRYLENKDMLEVFMIDHKVEKSDEIRQAILDLGDPGMIYYYAFWIDHCPRDDTRQAACKDPVYAYYYALDVDKCPRQDTRTIACKDPIYAYYYAIDVDQCPRDDTRAAVLSSPQDSYYYARLVDREPRDDTRQAASKDLHWKEGYEEWEKFLQKKK